MSEETRIDRIFDDLLYQTSKGATHSMLDRGIRYESFVQVKEWKARFGYRFSVYPNDHLIDGKKHFHLDNSEANVHCKLDFEGNVLEQKGKNSIPANVLKDLKYFLSKSENVNELNTMWARLNPSLA
jgi:hypothetical protein